jgi:hypothetical protein
MVALLLSAVAIMPVFGAVTGTVSVNKSFVAPLGNATITVDDADLNVLISATNTRTGTWATVGSTVFLSLDDTAGNSGASFASGTAAGDEISGIPTLAGATTAGKAKTDYSVTVFNKTTGRILVQFGGAVAPGADTLTLLYKVAAKNTTTAKVTSPSDATGISVTLTETGADTGKFEGPFSVTGTGATVSNDTTDAILAVPGQDITVKYTDASPSVSVQTTLRVENTKPVGALVSPASGSNTTSLTPKLTVDFTDVDSTVDSGKFTFTIAGATGASDAAVNIPVGTPTVTAITNGFRAVVTLDASLAKDKTVNIRWNATVSDKAGNVGSTDASASTSGNQDFSLVIDKQAPNFASATISAGAWWDAANSKVETDTTKSVNTSIGISLPAALDLGGTAFDIKEDLNGSTVTAADFEVDTLKQTTGVTLSDLTPTAANVYAGATNWIFLTVPAMAPDAKPSVTLKTTSGGISDAAGNATSAAVGPITGADKQAPTVTATLNRSLDDKDATLTITTDEAGGVPVVTVTSASEVSATPVAQTVTLVGTNQYESKITPGFGVHSVKVTVTDTSSNSAVAGGKAIDADWPASGAIALYVDNNLPAPTVNVNNIAASGASVESSEPFFVTAAYTGEKKEFGLVAGGTVTNDATKTIATDLDIQNSVTIATATLDGTSILGLLDTQDNNTFNFAVLGITTGEHELVIVGKDEAGNTHDTGKIKFTVTARKAYSVTMSAGWNLISFPGGPANGAIDTVLPSSHPATDVLSYDDGVWSVASRTAGSTWEGTLSSIDGNHGYWVNSSSSQPVEALLALTSVGSAATLPTIAVEAGWNLVSVIDLAQTKQGSTGDTQTGSNYFTSVDWSVAYSYDSSTRTWTRVTPAAGSVKNGQGVWVWATKAGTLIP